MSNADKRTVSTDALETLGTIIDDSQKRDAIHLAVLPMVASATLHAGDHVNMNGNEVAPYSPGAVGIVDPFLRVKVREGEGFWLVIYPRVITSLRHVWAHPAFPDEPLSAVIPAADDKATSEAWLRAFIDSADCPDYETVIAEAVNPSDSWDSDYLHFNGRDAHGEIPPEFWTHIEIVTGRKITARPSYFSCSC